jgi:type IV pilus assembly protein PilA
MSSSPRKFSLVRWFTVVLVLGILVSFVLVALPAYWDYSTRANVAKGLGMAVPAQARVIDNIASGAADLSAGWTAPQPTDGVAQIEINRTDGRITISYKPAAGGPGTIVLAPNSPAGGGLVVGRRPEGEIVWVCDGAASTLPPKYRPASCR